MQLPKKFVDTITKKWKVHGSDWLEQLPELVAYFSRKWELEHIAVYQNLSHQFVAHAYSHIYESNVVLKLYISQQALHREVMALHYFNGNGCVHLLNYETERGGILLSKITPGRTLANNFPKNDDLAVQTASTLMDKLHSNIIDPTKHNQFTSVQELLSLLYEYVPEQIERSHREKAMGLATELLASKPNTYILHGDLHHENILFDELHDQWIAIDPQGVVGERAYEVGAFIRNPIPMLLTHANAQARIDRRLDLFSQHLSLDRQRIANWSYVQAILAAYWALQDNCTSWHYFVACAELIT